MNINELMLELNKVLHASGWVEKATEYFRKHPEYFCEGTFSNVAGIDMSLNFFAKSLCDIENAERAMYIATQGQDRMLRRCNECSDGVVYTDTLGISKYLLPKKKEITVEQFFEYVENYAACVLHKWKTGEYCHSTRHFSYTQVTDWFEAQDVKDPPICYRDSRHAWMEFGGQFWRNTRTGETGQDKTILEVWF